MSDSIHDRDARAAERRQYLRENGLGWDGQPLEEQSWRGKALAAWAVARALAALALLQVLDGIERVRERARRR